jgi:hypothetical protein
VQDPRHIRKRGQANATEDLLKQTLEIWQPRSKSPLSRTEARNIAANMLGVIGILTEWDSRERQETDIVGTLKIPEKPQKRMRPL